MNVYLLRNWTHHEPNRPKGAPGLRQAGFKPPAGQAAVMLHLGNIPVAEDVTAAWIGERLKEAGFLFENEEEGLGVEEVDSAGVPRCESCGQPADGYTLDDVPLCKRCGSGLVAEEASPPLDSEGEAGV